MTGQRGRPRPNWKRVYTSYLKTSRFLHKLYARKVQRATLQLVKDRSNWLLFHGPDILTPKPGWSGAGTKRPWMITNVNPENNDGHHTRSDLATTPAPDGLSQRPGQSWPNRATLDAHRTELRGIWCQDREPGDQIMFFCKISLLGFAPVYKTHICM